MTVAELLRQLQDLPPTALVRVSVGVARTYPARSVRLTSVYREIGAQAGGDRVVVVVQTSGA